MMYDSKLLETGSFGNLAERSDFMELMSFVQTMSPMSCFLLLYLLHVRFY